MLGTDLALVTRAIAQPQHTRKALLFDGSTIYGTLSSPITLSGDFEIEVEALAPIAGSNYERLFASTSDLFALHLGSNSSSYLNGYVSDGSSSTFFTPTLVTINTSFLIKVTRIGNIFKFYFNNTLISTNTKAGVNVSMGYIGCRESFKSNKWRGYIHSVKITNQVTNTIYQYNINNGSTVNTPAVIPSQPTINWTGVTSGSWINQRLDRSVNPVQWVNV